MVTELDVTDRSSPSDIATRDGGGRKALRSLSRRCPGQQGRNRSHHLVAYRSRELNYPRRSEEFSPFAAGAAAKVQLLPLLH
jgi:hypothetical protein